MNLWALQDFFLKNCIFFDTISFCCFAQVRHCIFVSFFLYIILPSIIFPIIFYDTRNRPPDALTCRRGLLRQNPYLCPDIPVSTGLITAKSLSAPRYSAIDGAYYGKIPVCAPMFCQRWGLLRQNPYLRPDIPVSTGLITAKFLICAPMYKGGGYNRPDFVSHTRVRESRWV